MRKGVFYGKRELRLARALKYVPHVIRTIFFFRCIPKVSRVSVVLRAESWFSAHLKFFALVRENQLSARKTTPTRLTYGVRRTKKLFFLEIREFSHETWRIKGNVCFVWCWIARSAWSFIFRLDAYLFILPGSRISFSVNMKFLIVRNKSLNVCDVVCIISRSI